MGLAEFACVRVRMCVCARGCVWVCEKVYKNGMQVLVLHTVWRLTFIITNIITYSFNERNLTFINKYFFGVN